MLGKLIQLLIDWLFKKENKKEVYTMELKVVREIFTDNTTIGSFYIDGVFQCYTLEDKDRSNEPVEKRIKGETCVPYGVYKVVLRPTGGIWANLCKTIQGVGIERGCPHIYNIDGNKYPVWYASEGINEEAFVLIHTGNSRTDTLGCLLVGLERSTDFVGSSVKAFTKIYPIIADAITKGDSVTISYEKK